MGFAPVEEFLGVDFELLGVRGKCFGVVLESYHGRVNYLGRGSVALFASRSVFVESRVDVVEAKFRLYSHAVDMKRAVVDDLKTITDSTPNSVLDAQDGKTESGHKGRYE